MQEITKSIIRKTILQCRQLLDPTVFEQRNQLLIQRLKEFIKKERYRVIHLFLPIKKHNEPDLTGMLPWLWERGREVMVSKTNFATREMKHYYLEPETVLKVGPLEIPEPVSAKPACFDKVELVLVPLVTADRQGNRIGYGGGFYDQLLMTQTKAVKAGLCLSPLMDEVKQKDKWDICLDKVMIGVC